MKSFIIIGFISMSASLFSCKTEEIILHGNILGFVTDASTNIPVEDAAVNLRPGNDSTLTLSDGSYNFRNLTPGQYEIEASKISYADSKENIVVAEGETQQIDFSLNGIPVPAPSVNFLDFGLDSTTLRFSISNTGKGNFAFFLTPNQDWITVSPSNGIIRNDTMNFIVTVNKTGLSENIYKENIKVISFAGQVPLPEMTIPVYLNGVSDHDGNYYKVVRIGTQIWMAENLNVGIPITFKTDSKDNGIVEKFCYGDAGNNCIDYGGLFQWDEMMQYNSSDNGISGNTPTVCPNGWHVPTRDEWDILIDQSGGVSVAGGKLKEAGYAHWIQPNLGATNEYGFTALPGGSIDSKGGYLPQLIGFQGIWWTSSEFLAISEEAYCMVLTNNSDLNFDHMHKRSAISVRCIKNP